MGPHTYRETLFYNVEMLIYRPVVGNLSRGVLICLCQQTYGIQILHVYHMTFSMYNDLI